MSLHPGVRERKKQRTRETIARAAHELFAERGYHATTLPEIAEAADVSTRTIFAYFPSKEDILFCDFPVMKEALTQALAERPEGVEALETVREFILSSHNLEKTELEEVIAAAIAKDIGAAEDDLRPHVVAASLTAAFIVLTERGGSKAKPQTPAQVAALIDPVITFLRGGLEAVKEPRAPKR